MGWFDMFSRKAGATADARDITIFKGTPQHAGSGSPEASAIPDAPPPLSEEIKRRQVALIINYVTAIRAR